MAILSFTTSAQEIVKELFIRGVFDFETEFKLFDRIYTDDDRIYFDIRVDSVHNELLESNNFMELDFDLEPSGGDYIFEYEPGVGVVDYTFFNFKSYRHSYSIDGNHLAFCTDSAGNFIDGQSIPLNDDIPNQGDNIIVYDMLNDSILWYYNDTILGENQQLEWQEIGIEGDFIYYATTYWNEQVFMGDTLGTLYPEYGPFQYSTMLHKINWRTNEKVWSKHMEGEERVERVRQIKVIDDGTLMIAIEINRPFTFDGEVYDPPGFYNGGGTNPESDHNMVIAKISQDGEYIDHIHIKTLGDRGIKDVKIEDTGEVYAYGVLRPGVVVEFENDTITFDQINDESFQGIFFAFDPNFELLYYKKYISNHAAWITGAGFISNDNIAFNIHMRDSVFIENEVYRTMYQDPDVNFNVFESLLVVYDKEGNIVRDPIRFGKEQRIVDIIELDEEYYLIAVIGRSRTSGEGPLFLGADITYNTDETNTYQDYAQIIEVRGPLFDVVSSIHETLNNQEFEIHPNISSSNMGVNLVLPAEIQGQDAKVKILDLTGNTIYSERINNPSSFHFLTLPVMKSGIKIVLIETQEKIYKSTLTIIN